MAQREVGYAMMYAVGLLALFIGAFLIFNTFRTVVVERRHDLAMLRAIGASRRQITMLILVESLYKASSAQSSAFWWATSWLAA